MKTTLTALAISACMLGIGSAASDAKPKRAEAAIHQTAKPHAKADRKKVVNEKNAHHTEARAKSADEKTARKLAAQLKKIDARKAQAEAKRRKAAEALKAAENQVAAVDAEKKKLEARKQAQETAARSKVEIEKKREAQQAEAKERQNVARMQGEIRELNQTIERLTQQVSALHAKPGAPQKDKKMRKDKK